MCELLRFGLIRELQLSTNHFHCIFFEREVGIRSIGVFGSLIAEFMFGKVSCAGFCSQAFLCPASNFPRP